MDAAKMARTIHGVQNRTILSIGPTSHRPCQTNEYDNHCGVNIDPRISPTNTEPRERKFHVATPGLDGLSRIQLGLGLEFDLASNDGRVRHL